MKIFQVGAELFHADLRDSQTDGRTDMTKLIVAIRNFANAIKKASLLVSTTCPYRIDKKSFGVPGVKCYG
jgi:hypothetical protein